MIISINLVVFIDFEASFVILLKDNGCKNAPKHDRPFQGNSSGLWFRIPNFSSANLKKLSVSYQQASPTYKISDKMI